MNNLTANINRGAKGVQGDFYYVDGAHHSGAEASRLEQ
jgi:hypothetical protein